MAFPASEPPPVSLAEIGRVLEETARLIRMHGDYAAGLPVAAGTEGEIGAADVRAVITARWMRRRYLGFEPADAAWSMMLELFAARLEGRTLSQTRLGIAAGLPQTTALHVTRRMLESGAFTRQADPGDRRLLLIGLGDGMTERMGDYLRAVGRLAPLAA